MFNFCPVWYDVLRPLDDIMADVKSGKGNIDRFDTLACRTQGMYWSHNFICQYRGIGYVHMPVHAHV